MKNINDIVQGYSYEWVPKMNVDNNSKENINKQFKKVRAIFNPKKTDDLRPELLKCIGEEFTFQYSWIMDEDEQFPGVWALNCWDDERFMYWTPEFDLNIIENLD